MEFDFEAGANPVSDFFTQNPSLLREPTRGERLEAGTELFGCAVSGHPLELFEDVAWATYCPVAQVGERAGETVVTCGPNYSLKIIHNIFLRILRQTGEFQKFP